MSETSNQNARSLTSAEDLDDDEMPPLSSPVRTSTNTSRRAHRRRPQRTSANHDAGHLSDASMPSLQSVSDSSEAEVMSDSDSEEDVDEGGDDSPPPPLASALPSFANDRLSSLLEQTRPSGRDREDRSTAAEQERFQAAWQHWQSSPTDPHPPNRASQGENVRTDIEDMLNYRSRAANGNNANPINNPLENILETVQRIRMAMDPLRIGSPFQLDGSPNVADLQNIGTLNIGTMGAFIDFFNAGGIADEDPERAEVIVKKLETVPKDLVRRYEKLRGGIVVDDERDFDGCAICRDALLVDDIEVRDVTTLEKETVVLLDESGASSSRISKSTLNPHAAIFTPTTSSPTSPMTPQDPPLNNSNTDPSSSKSILSRPEPASLSILAFPCPGMHLYHADCIAPWLARKTTCPSCRFDIDPNSVTHRLNRVRAMAATNWKPPKGRDFRKWLKKEEKKRGGILDPDDVQSTDRAEDDGIDGDEDTDTDDELPPLIPDTMLPTSSAQRPSRLPPPFTLAPRYESSGYEPSDVSEEEDDDDHIDDAWTDEDDVEDQVDAAGDFAAIVGTLLGNPPTPPVINNNDNAAASDEDSDEEMPPLVPASLGPRPPSGNDRGNPRNDHLRPRIPSISPRLIASLQNQMDEELLRMEHMSTLHVPGETGVLPPLAHPPTHLHTPQGPPFTSTAPDAELISARDFITSLGHLETSISRVSEFAASLQRTLEDTHILPQDVPADPDASRDGGLGEGPGGQSRMDDVDN